VNKLIICVDLSERFAQENRITVSQSLNRANIRHKGGLYGRPSTCKGAFSLAAQQHARVTQPNLLEDQRQALSTRSSGHHSRRKTLPKEPRGEGADTLNGIRTMVDFKDGSSQKAKRKRLIYEISLFSGVLWLYNPGTRLMSAARCDYATSAVF
jgi:hypothetical protein